MKCRICPTCGQTNNISDFYCLNSECGVDIGYVEPTDSPESVSQSKQSDARPLPETDRCGNSAPAEQGSLKCPSLTCGLDQPPADECVRCGTPLEPGRTWHVIWPWGEETRVVDGLEVGRDSSPSWLSKRLSAQNYDNLSRRHARLVVRSGALYVVDLGSSNGTFIEGIRIVADKDAVVPQSGRLRFASNLEIQCRLGQAL